LNNMAAKQILVSKWLWITLAFTLSLKSCVCKRVEIHSCHVLRLYKIKVSMKNISINFGA